MVSFPPCKINLGLYITRKRPDGFHDLVTCFYPVAWNDILEIIPSSDFLFSSSGLSIPGAEGDNLCIKAYQLLKDDFDIPPVHIHLHKIIPMGAGLGGGSSNAAWTLRLLNDIFSLRLSPSALEQYAARLGSDCAFFIRDKAMIGRGRGEVLTETTVDLRGKFFIVVNPLVHVSTAEAFSGVIPRRPDHDLQYILENVSITEWKHAIRNDFEESIMKKYPAIAGVKDLLYSNGALYASMSGSGSSVFGIFSSPVNMEEAFTGMHSYSGKF